MVNDARAGDPLAEVKMLGRAALAHVLDPEFVTLNRTVIAESNHFPELASFAADCWGSVFVGGFAELIRNAQRADLCKTGDPTVIARTFLWSLVGMPFYSALIGGDELFAREDELNDYFEMTWQLFLHGVVRWKNPASFYENFAWPVPGAISVPVGKQSDIQIPAGTTKRC